MFFKTQDSHTAAFVKGKMSFRAGESLEACPYPWFRYLNCHMWREGFYQAELDKVSADIKKVSDLIFKDADTPTRLHLKENEEEMEAGRVWARAHANNSGTPYVNIPREQLFATNDGANDYTLYVAALCCRERKTTDMHNHTLFIRARSTDEAVGALLSHADKQDWVIGAWRVQEISIEDLIAFKNEKRGIGVQHNTSADK